MPVTLTEYPILLTFTCAVRSFTGEQMIPTDIESTQQEGESPKKLPRGVVLGKDGKP